MVLYVPRTHLEQRTPAAATQALTYMSPGRPMVPAWSAAEAVRWAYYANVFVFACVRAIAEDISALPFRAGLEIPDAGKPGRYDLNAPLARLLGPAPGGPNPSTDAETFVAWSIVQRLVTGRMAWEIETATGSDRPVALWPLVSSSLDVIPSEGRSTQWFKGFEYGRPGDKRRLQPDQVFYHHQPAADDWRQAESALQAARLDVSVAVMQDRYDYAFLMNDARPAAVVVHEAFAAKEQERAFRAQWNAEHRGVDNAGRTAFVAAQGGDGGVSGAIDVKILGLSQKDAGFIERYEAKLRAICVAIGVPMSRLMDASKRTFSNADVETTNYWRNTVLSLVRRLGSAINMQLAPRLGPHVGWFDTSGVEALQPPKWYSTEGLPQLVASGIISRNEARVELGLAPAKEAETPPPPPVSPSAPAPAPSEPRVLPVVEHRGPTPEQLEERRAKTFAANDAKTRAAERTWARSMAALFDRQGRAVVANFTSKRGRRAVAEVRADLNPDSIFDRAYWTAETRSAAESLYEMVLAQGAGTVATALGVSFDVLDAWAAEFVQLRANQLAGQVTETTYGAVKDAMASGLAEGESIPKLAERIRAVFSEASTSRATTIARTEVISAFNGSAATFAAQLGPDVVAAQEWVATRDGRTRVHHADADGQVAIIGTPFTVGGAEMAYPGDPSGPAREVVNCRCTLLLLTPEEMVERGLMATVPVATARAILYAVQGVHESEIERRVRAAVRRAA